MKPSAVRRQRRSHHSPCEALLGLALSMFAIGLAPRTALAQRAIAWDCDYGHVSEFGYSVIFAGDGDGDVIVGAPRHRSTTSPYEAGVGAVHFPGLPGYVEGDGAGDRLGFALAGGLDVDGDGRLDVLAGAPGDDDVAPDCGSVTVFSGADRSVLYRVFGQARGDALGSSIACVGDLDGDGRADFLAGAPRSETGQPGYARVFSGASGDALATHIGALAGDGFGFAVLGLADLDGDDVPDYAVSAPRALVGGAPRGIVQLFSGADGSLLQTHSGEDVDGLFGFSLATGSDLDRDGRAELCVGAPGAAGGRGRVHVFRSASGPEWTRLVGEATGSWFGAALAGALDFDGDGHGDVVVGAPDGDPGATLGLGGPGAASVFSGADGRVLARMGGGSGGAGLGVSVAGGADVDGDGLDDVIVGGRLANDGYGESSCVVLLARPTGGRVQSDDPGPGSFSGLGTSVAHVGDLDGDGLADALVGEPEGRDSAGQRRGRARVISAVDGRTLLEVYGDALDDRLGQSVAGAGDVDGDGVPDLLVGSARSASHGPGWGLVGYAKLFSGATGAELWHLPGPGGSAFGSALAGGGDIDGDGFDDVIVGGAVFDLQGTGSGEASGVGHVRVFSGHTGTLLFAFDGLAYGESLGRSVAILDDLDGDGRCEFLIGVPGRVVDAPFFTLGEVELHAGSDGSVLYRFHTYDLRLGMASCRLGDVDGDGVGDLALASWDPQQLWSSGTVYVHSGSDYRLLWSRWEQTPYEGPSFGYSLAPAGDVDGDGAADLAVGFPGWITSYGASIGRALVLSGTGGATLASYDGYSGWDYFGYSVAGLGDADGDGRPDLAIGAPTDPYNWVGAAVGQDRVHLALSGHLERYRHCVPTLHSGGATARLDARGFGRLADNDLTLLVTDALPGRAGVFFFGERELDLPFGSGRRCVGGSVRRLPGLAVADASGLVQRALDLTRAPLDALQAGRAWSFQFWFRDPDGGGANLSDALRITLRP